MQKTPGLEVTVRGQYYCNIERGKALKIYKNEIFHLPETMIIKTGMETYIKTVDGRKIKRARVKKEKVSTRVWLKHIVFRLCLPARLKEKYEDYSGVRTCIIENIKRIAELPESELGELLAKDIKTMSLTDLLRFTTTEGISVPLDSFADLDDARQAVADEYDKAQMAEKGIETSVVGTEEAPLGGANSESIEPDKETVGDDGVPTEHFTDPSLKGKGGEEEPAPTAPVNDLLD